jgi:two-component system, NtrC family, response regulator HydG
VARILLVEDYLDVRLLLEHVMLGAGHGVDVAETLAQARVLLGSASYDLVIADGRLPDGNGIEIADAAKAMGMKTLIISGFAFQGTDELRRHEYLMKPVRPSELLLVLRRMIGEV